MGTGDSPFPYRGPPGLQAAVVAALREVVDPEVALSIVDLGLVYGVQIDEHGALMTMTMTSAACPVADVIVEDVEIVLADVLADRLPAGCPVSVQLVWQPAWTPALMSDSARRFMA